MSNIPLRAGFDHALDPALRSGNWGEWNLLREQSAGFLSDIAPGYDLWYLLRYNDVSEGFRNFTSFSSRTTRYLPDRTQRQLPLELDPPSHEKYRRVLNPYFSPKRVLQYEPMIRAYCRELVGVLAPAGRLDLVTRFALRFPTAVFLKIMGLPVERCDEFVDRAHGLMHATNVTDPEGSVRHELAEQIRDDLQGVIAARRLQPRDDVISCLASETVGDLPISDADLVAVCFLLFLAGLDTVASLLTYVFRHLAQDEALRRLLIDEPRRVPAAVEEFLRLYSVATAARVVARDIEFGGCPMKQGDRVVLPTAPANRDPRRFANPDHFDLDRTDNQHIAFGVGRHRCLGSHLARLEIRIAIEEWHKLIPEYRVTAVGSLPQRIGNVASLTSLPLEWPVP